jgi:hypothetical protein
MKEKRLGTNEYVRTARPFPFEVVRLLVPCLLELSPAVCISSICPSGAESEVVATCFRFLDLLFFTSACCDELWGRTLGTLLRTGGRGCRLGCFSVAVDDTMADVVDSCMTLSISAPLAAEPVSTVLDLDGPCEKGSVFWLSLADSFLNHSRSPTICLQRPSFPT